MAYMAIVTVFIFEWLFQGHSHSLIGVEATKYTARISMFRFWFDGLPWPISIWGWIKTQDLDGYSMGSFVAALEW